MSPDQRVIGKEQNNKAFGLFIDRANIISTKIMTRERYTYKCLKSTIANEEIKCVSWCKQTLVGERLEIYPRKMFLLLDYCINCIKYQLPVYEIDPAVLDMIPYVPYSK